MADVDVRPDVAVLEALEFEPDCDSKYHATGNESHDPNQPASWLVIGPCAHQAQRCDRWVQYVIIHTSPVLCDCGTEHSFNELRYIPIGTP